MVHNTETSVTCLAVYWQNWQSNIGKIAGWDRISPLVGGKTSVGLWPLATGRSASDRRERPCDGGESGRCTIILGRHRHFGIVDPRNSEPHPCDQCDVCMLRIISLPYGKNLPQLSRRGFYVDVDQTTVSAVAKQRLLCLTAVWWSATRDGSSTTAESCRCSVLLWCTLLCIPVSRQEKDVGLCGRQLCPRGRQHHLLWQAYVYFYYVSRILYWGQS